MGEIIDGRAIAARLRERIAEEMRGFCNQTGIIPHLAAVLVGDDPASAVYVRGKQRACDEVGLRSTLHRLDRTASQDDLLTLVGRLNADADVHGILVQLPLPEQINETTVLDAVTPLKDVDCFHPENVGRLSQGRPRFLPCTPAGCQHLLVESGVNTDGAHVVVLGRSEIVGKPMALLMLQKGRAANATVTVCHSRTRDLAPVCRSADILIVAIGRTKFITAEMVKPGAAVVDVGINRTDEGLVGDVDFDSVREVAGHISPVPGGVGPLTITMLLQNTLTAARQQEA